MKVYAISLMLSCDCNLSCKYCILNKNNKENKQKARDLQATTVQALKDGTFFKNTKAVMQKLNQDPLYVHKLEFWGQESTLSVPYFTDHAEQWLEEYPNVDAIMFSTNGTTNVQIIKDFINKIDSIAKHEITLNIQYSYDGWWSTTYERGADPDVIKNNFLELVRFCENQNFKYVRMDLAGHSVFSYNLLEYLMEDTAHIYDYENELREIILESQPTKNKDKIDCGWGVGMELPYNTSVKQAKDVTKLIKFYFNESGMKQDKYSALGHLVYYLFKGGRKDPPEDIDEMCSKLSNIITDRRVHDSNNNCMFCGACINHIKVMYDGTLLGCQNFMYDLSLKDGNYRFSCNPFEKAVNETIIEHNHNFNPLKDDPKDYELMLQIAEIQEHDSIVTQVHQVASLMLALAKCGQIDSCYLTDKKKLMADALFVATKNVCAYNHAISTGSYFLKQPGYIRLMCNGITDIIREKKIRNDYLLKR